MVKYIYSKQGNVILVGDQQVKIITNRSLYSYIQQRCIMYGCTYDGRKKAGKIICHINQKVPILMSDQRKELLFPTRRVKDEDCIWINYFAIKTVKRDSIQSLIIFHQGDYLCVDCDVRSIKRELRICKDYVTYLESLEQIDV